MVRVLYIYPRNCVKVKIMSKTQAMSSVGFNSKLSGIEFRAAGWQGGSGGLIYIDFYLLLLKLPPFLALEIACYE